MSTNHQSAVNPKPPLPDDTRPGAFPLEDLLFDAFPSESTLVAAPADLADNVLLDDFPSEASLPVAIDPSQTETATVIAVAAASQRTPRPPQRQHTRMAAAAFVAVVIGATLGFGLPTSSSDRTETQTVSSIPEATSPLTADALNEDASAPLAPAPAVINAPTPPVDSRFPAVTRAAAPTSRPVDGEIHITTAPSGARVTIDGIGWGVTPVTASHLTFGTKTIRLTRDGYASEQAAVALSADRPTQSVSISMTPRR